MRTGRRSANGPWRRLGPCCLIMLTGLYQVIGVAPPVHSKFQRRTLLNIHQAFTNWFRCSVACFQPIIFLGNLADAAIAIGLHWVSRHACTPFRTWPRMSASAPIYCRPTRKVAAFCVHEYFFLRSALTAAKRCWRYQSTVPSQEFLED